MSQKWRRFEKLVANVQKELAPDANVQHNDHIWGHYSKKNRQIDVSIRKRIGQFELLIAISCKDWSEPVDIDEIDSFSNVIKDIHAHKGAMVATNGFTGGAKNMAKAKGIDLYRLIDAEPHEWQTYISVPVICDFRSLHKFKFALPSYLANTDPYTIMLFNASQQKLGNIVEVLHKRWNTGQLPSETGEHGWIPIFEGKTKTLYKGRFDDADISAKICVRNKLYFGQLQLIDIKGFRDEHTGAIATNSFTTEWLDAKRVERDWMQIVDPSEIAVTPLFVLTALDIYEMPK